MRPDSLQRLWRYINHFYLVHVLTFYDYTAQYVSGSGQPSLTYTEQYVLSEMRHNITSKTEIKRRNHLP